MAATASRRRGPQVLTATGVGLAAWLGGYLVTYLLEAGDVDEALVGINFLRTLFGGDPIPTWKGVVWLFFNAHLVVARGGNWSANFIEESDRFGPELYILPIAVLLVAGLIVGRYATDGRETVASRAVRAGGGIATGYAIVCILATILSRASFGDGAVGPDPVTAVLLAGIVYPAVLGTTGALVAALIDTR